jgi:hypothetical protein
MKKNAGCSAQRLKLVSQKNEQQVDRKWIELRVKDGREKETVLERRKGSYQCRRGMRLEQ